MTNTLSETEQLYWNVFEAASDGILIIDLETGSILAANPAAAELHGYKRRVLREVRMQRLIHPKSLPFFADFAQIIQGDGLFEMMAQHVKQDESLLSVEWRAVAIQYQGHACALAILRDVSKRVQAEHQLHQRVGLRAREQAALLEISQTLASALELQPSLILDQLGVLIPFTHAGLFVLEDSTLVTQAVRYNNALANSTGNETGKTGPFRIRLSEKQAQDTLFNGGHPIRISAINSNEPSAKFLRSLMENESAVLLENVQSWMWVPLAVKNHILGGIGIAHAERNYFTTHHAGLAMTIANQVAVTLANAELYEHAQALAALQERQRLAQNLHDAVNQSLFSAGLIAEVLPRLWERNPDEARRSLQDLRRLTRGALAEMRALLAELRPTTLTDAELGELLRLLGNAFTGRTNIPVKVTVNGESSLPAETQVALYRICQEAMNNIAKHAKASQVEIDVQHITEKLEMHIRDNGQGFDTGAAPPPGHYGMGMMSERAEAIGAVLTITSKPGQGTQLTIQWKKQEGL